MDEINQAFLYSPIDDVVIPVEDFPTKVEGVLWENYEPDKVFFQFSKCLHDSSRSIWWIFQHIFAAFDDRNLYTFSYVRDSIYGEIR